MTNIHLSGRRLAAIGGVAMLVLAAVIAVMAMSANAASTTLGVKTVKVGGKSEPIAVNAKGVFGVHAERRVDQAPGVHQSPHVLHRLAAGDGPRQDDDGRRRPGQAGYVQARPASRR